MSTKISKKSPRTKASLRRVGEFARSSAYDLRVHDLLGLQPSVTDAQVAAGEAGVTLWRAFYEAVDVDGLENSGWSKGPRFSACFRGRAIP